MNGEKPTFKLEPKALTLNAKPYSPNPNLIHLQAGCGSKDKPQFCPLEPSLLSLGLGLLI